MIRRADHSSGEEAGRDFSIACGRKLSAGLAEADAGSSQTVRDPSRRALDDFLHPQISYFIRRKPKLRQNLFRLLAEFRWPCHHFAWRARQGEGLTDQADVAAFLIGHVLSHAEMLNLSIGEHLVDGVDRTAGNAGGIELLHPGLARFLLRVFVDLGVERFSVL